MATKKQNLGSSLIGSFFSFLWHKLVALWNYIVDKAVKFVEVLKQLLPRITSIEAICEFEISESNPNPHFLFKVQVELAWLALSAKFSLELEYGSDSTIA